MRQNVAMLERSDRPWGSYTVLSDEADHKVKRIVVHPGRRLSYQRHSQRSEHWFIVSGSGNFVLDDATKPVGPGDAVDIPRGSAHRIENTPDRGPPQLWPVAHPPPGPTDPGPTDPAPAGRLPGRAAR